MPRIVARTNGLTAGFRRPLAPCAIEIAARHRVKSGDFEGRGLFGDIGSHHVLSRRDASAPCFEAVEVSAVGASCCRSDPGPNICLNCADRLVTAINRGEGIGEGRSRRGLDD